MAATFRHWFPARTPTYFRVRTPVQAFGIGPGDVPSAPIRELAAGDLIEVGERLGHSKWLRVRLPLETEINPMSETDLKMQNSVIPIDTELEQGTRQLDDRVAGRFPVAPAHLLMRYIWYLQESKYIPDGLKPTKSMEKFLADACVEHFPGKVFGITQEGLYVIQRGKGNIPERLGCADWCILDRRQRIKRSFIWSYGGLVFAASLGGLFFISKPTKRKTFQGYMGWLVWSTILVAPFSAIGTFAFCQSAFSSAVMSTSMCGLLLHDFFYD